MKGSAPRVTKFSQKCEKWRIFEGPGEISNSKILAKLGRSQMYLHFLVVNKKKYIDFILWKREKNIFGTAF